VLNILKIRHSFGQLTPCKKTPVKMFYPHALSYQTIKP
jgi:hypothetical protein